ncbi:MAG: hypothetical protein IKJ35_08775 [Clostridia bacterium]|nr:hypothetical protein [Clostridia bacterium]
MKTRRIISILLCAAMCLGALVSFSACSSCKNTTKNTDALVIMSEDMDGLFNPFYSTTGADANIVSMTQIGMLTTGYENENVTVACGDGEAVVVKDYQISHDSVTNKTTYTFVIKNGIKFSDGKPLTMNDVLFNLYVYLDPVYSGSSTMYSTDIVGLQAYRTQQILSNGDDADDNLTNIANARAKARIDELINLFQSVGKTPTQGSFDAGYDQMIAAIATHKLSDGYKKALSNDTASVTNDQLKADYEQALKLFKEELGTDFASAKEAYLEEPYKTAFTNLCTEKGLNYDVLSFMYAEGFVTIEYAKDPVTNKPLKNKIEKVTPDYNTAVAVDEASAINYVYNSKISTELHTILRYWATAQKLNTEYTAKAKEVLLRENMKEGQLAIPNISGIVSLGHTTDRATVTAKNGTYTVAHSHNPDGTVTNPDSEYDVLEITINGVDPKAIWNFAFSVAPQHYYAEGYTVDIANNKFGVEYGSFDFMKNVIQSSRNVKVPMGAGAYKATDINNNDNPDGNAFFSNNIVYFKANQNFLLGSPKIEKVRYQVVSASNAINALESGSVHFVTPQFTKDNKTKLDSLKAEGISMLWTDQLGYGYIGINAGKVKDINLRKAIMTAMDTNLALSYYDTGMAETIFWPMSTVSWAYPKQSDGKTNESDNMHDYPAPKFNREAAKQKILDFMDAAGVPAGHKDLSIKFTIAGSNLTDHPTYQTFQSAADLLNECGWDIEVVPDTQALTKLSSGSLAVWAAAWGTTVDPDMYQVYHKNSTATSTLAWGYREILANEGTYPEETMLLNQLSELIDKAREVEDQATRAGLYKEAMGKVLDLAIELPVYQRKVLYAYNAEIIDANSLPAEINPYSSPLDKIWTIEFAD